MLRECEKIANDFIKKNGLIVPIQLEKIALLLDVRIIYDNFESLDGMLYKSHHHNYVIINKQNTIEHQRFSIAHEFSHIILGHKGTMLNCDLTAEKTFEEKCADACASELLMPTDAICTVGKNLLYNVKCMKKYFYVSEKAMYTKLKLLGLPTNNTIYNKE